jgi:hypothetical protein
MSNLDQLDEQSVTTKQKQACNHTLHLTDKAGKPQGTWIEERIEKRVRVICRVCGRFYGYRAES